jgi:serine/threonine protein phosphatase PrpC
VAREKTGFNHLPPTRPTIPGPAPGARVNAAAALVAAPDSGWRLRSASRTHTGRVRAHNEDSLVDRPGAGLWAVADGMGGHSKGDLASGRIREALEQIEPPGELEAYVALVRERLEAVHRGLMGEARSGTCGSTVAALLARGGRCACVWAGDSRVYRLRAGRLERLTRDHSLVEELVAIGAVKPEDARSHPLANRITRADVESRLAPGDRYLVSTDGVHGVLPHDVLATLLALPSLEAAADSVVAAVLNAGAPDNLTLVLVAAEHAAAADAGATLPAG